MAESDKTTSGGVHLQKVVESALSRLAPVADESAKKQESVRQRTVTKYTTAGLQEVNRLLEQQLDLREQAIAYERKVQLMEERRARAEREHKHDLEANYAAQKKAVEDQLDATKALINEEETRARVQEKVVELEAQLNEAVVHRSSAYSSINKDIKLYKGILDGSLKTQTHITQTMQKQRLQAEADLKILSRKELLHRRELRYHEEMSKHKNAIRSNVGVATDDAESQVPLSLFQRMKVGMAGMAAGVFALDKGIDRLKQGLRGLSNDMDLVVEQQYMFGTSMKAGANDYKDYVSKVADMSMINMDLKYSFAKMGLDAEQANDVIAKLVTTSATARNALHDNNSKAISAMGVQVGRFSRLTGLSIDEAMEVQQSFFDHFSNMTPEEQIKKAQDGMTGIVGSITGVNDALRAGGFKGSNLEVAKFAHMAKEAAEASENLGLNVGAYAKNLALAAGNARKLGINAKIADRVAAHLGKASQEKDAQRDFQQGRIIEKTLTSKFGADIDKGDQKALAAKLLADKSLGIADKGIANEIAGSLIKKGPNYLQNLTNASRGSTIQMASYESYLKPMIAEKGYDLSTEEGVFAAASALRANPDMRIYNWLGIQPGDDDEYATLVTKLSQAGGLASKPKDESDGILSKLKSVFKTPTAGIQNADAHIEEATKRAGEDNGPWSPGKMLAAPQALLNSTPGNLLTGAGITASVLGGGYLARKRLGSSVRSFLGRGASEVAENGAEAATKAGAEAATSTVGKSGLKTAIAALAKSKRGKILLGAASLLGIGGLGYGASKAIGGVESRAGAANDLLSKPGADDTTVENTDSTAENTKAVTELTNTLRGRNSAPSYGGGFESSMSGNALNSAGTLAVNAGVSGVSKLASMGASKFAPEITSKIGAKLGTTALKTGARAIPLLGPIISGLITGAMTDGPMGRKIFAGLGDFGGTALGQLATGGIGGGIIGGVGGEFAAKEAYDRFFGDRSGSPTGSGYNPAAVTRVSSESAPVPGNALIGMPGGGRQTINAGSTNFGNVKNDGSLEFNLKFKVADFARTVDQASTMTLASSTQMSGAKK